MKKQFIISLLCVAVLSGSLPAAFAAETTAAETAVQSEMQALTNVIASVKSRITIPEELSEFSSSSYENEGQMFYQLRWTDAVGEKSISVTADNDGNIISYRDRSRDQGDYNAVFTKAEAVSQAQSFLAQIAPDRVHSLVYSAENSAGYIGSGYSIFFNRMSNGIPLNRNTASVTVLKSESGEYFISNANITWDDDLTIKNIGETISAEEIGDKFKESLPLELHYRKAYTWTHDNSNEENVLLEYYFPDGLSYINAETGEIIEEDSYNYYNMSANESAAVSGGSGGGSSADRGQVSLTPEELAEVEAVADLIPAETLAETLKSTSAFAIPGEAELTSQSTIKNDDGTYIRSVTLEVLDGEESQYDTEIYHAYFNAQTGELRTCSAPRIYSDEQYTSDQYDAACNAATGFIEGFTSEKYAQCEPIEFSEYNEDRQFIDGTATRLVDSVPYDSNTISVTVDVKSGVITSYSLNWDSDISSLPKVSEAVSMEEAYDTLLEAYPPRLIYIKSGGAYTLSYELPADTQYVSYTGTLTDYLGREYETDRVVGDYTDIDGHWAEASINLLADYGMGFTGGQFLPDTLMTQSDFLRFASTAFYSTSYASSSEDELYDMFIASGVISEDEKDPTAEITREDAVTYIIRFAGLRNVAELEGIYVCGFADDGDISPDRYGYCALAKGFGIVSGDGGYFYPQNTVSRAEAAVMLLNYINSGI